MDIPTTHFYGFFPSMSQIIQLFHKLKKNTFLTSIFDFYSLAGDNVEGLQFIMSRKGHRQLVHQNYIHTKYSVVKGKTNWRCIDYYTDIKCRAFLETVDAAKLFPKHYHNHPDHSEKIMKCDAFTASISSLVQSTDHVLPRSVHRFE